MGTTPVNHIENNTRVVPIQFHRNEWTVIIHSSATVIQFSIQQFFKRTYALNKWAPLPMGNISHTIEMKVTTSNKISDQVADQLGRCPWNSKMVGSCTRSAHIWNRSYHFRQNSQIGYDQEFPGSTVRNLFNGLMGRCLHVGSHSAWHTNLPS